MKTEVRRQAQTVVFLRFGLVAAVWLSGCEDSPKKAAAPPPAAKSIIGEKTQTVLDVKPELAKGAVVCTDPNNPYYSALVKVVVPAMRHSLDIHHAETDAWPQNAQEFVDQILKADNVALDRLPDGLAYGYDAENHTLVVLEYPERKARREARGRGD